MIVIYLFEASVASVRNSVIHQKSNVHYSFKIGAAVRVRNVAVTDGRHPFIVFVLLI